MRPRVIPAEDLNRRCWTPTQTTSFNEAAGNPRGRPESQPAAPQSYQRFNEAAGNPRGRLEPHAKQRRRRAASMRPRVIPAEDGNMQTTSDFPVILASMRPRVIPAEDDDMRQLVDHQVGASMRPRVIPAEDVHLTAHDVREAGLQ